MFVQCTSPCCAGKRECLSEAGGCIYTAHWFADHAGAGAQKKPKCAI